MTMTHGGVECGGGMAELFSICHLIFFIFHLRESIDPRFAAQTSLYNGHWKISNDKSKMIIASRAVPRDPRTFVASLKESFQRRCVPAANEIACRGPHSKLQPALLLRWPPEWSNGLPLSPAQSPYNLPGPDLQSAPSP